MQGSGAELLFAAAVSAFSEAKNHAKWCLFLMHVKLVVCYSQPKVEMVFIAFCREGEGGVALSPAASPGLVVSPGLSRSRDGWKTISVLYERSCWWLTHW